MMWLLVTVFATLPIICPTRPIPNPVLSHFPRWQFQAPSFWFFNVFYVLVKNGTPSSTRGGCENTYRLSHKHICNEQLEIKKRQVIIMFFFYCVVASTANCSRIRSSEKKYGDTISYFLFVSYKILTWSPINPPSHTYIFYCKFQLHVNFILHERHRF